MDVDAITDYHFKCTNCGAEHWTKDLSALTAKVERYEKKIKHYESGLICDDKACRERVNCGGESLSLKEE